MSDRKRVSEEELEVIRKRFIQESSAAEAMAMLVDLSQKISEIPKSVLQRLRGQHPERCEAIVYEHVLQIQSCLMLDFLDARKLSG